MYRSTALACTVLALVACSASPSPDAEENRDTTPSASAGGTSRQVAILAKGCKKTLCQQKEEQDSQGCGQCMDACLGAGDSCDLAKACESNCAYRGCSDGDDQACAEEGFIVTLPARDQEVASQCERFSARNVSCGAKATDCDTPSRTLGPTGAQYYSCIADLPCHYSDWAFQDCVVPPSTIGDRFCWDMNARCNGFCDEPTRYRLNALGAVVSERFFDALVTTCGGQEACSDARACYDAWEGALR